MKKSYLLIITFFLIQYGFGQTGDSIKVSKNNRDMLIGTSVLHGSEKNMSAATSHGLYLDNIKSSDCLTSNSEHLPATEIKSIHVNDSLLTIDIVTTANCSHHFLGEIEVLGDSVLNLSYHTYGGYAFCNCCFGLTYFINIIKEQNFNPDKVKFAMIGDKKRTMKYINWKSK
jgi:hypothetical protein